ncbi:MAG: hypothetical protein IJW49_06700, partial [Clostridia bacterium]|nr:hypothetical protein [Clostridia bacterium]
SCNNKETEFSTPGYDVLYGYLSNRSPDEQLHYENTSYKYHHEYVAIEARQDVLCIFVCLPVENSKFHDTISLKLKNNEEKAGISIAFADRSKETLYGYIDLTTYSVESDVIWGLETWQLGEEYGKHLADGLIFAEYYIKNEFDVSLKDLGFVNF